MAGPRLVRVQDKGQVTLPAATRRRLGLKKGDLVAVTETAEGVLITPQPALVSEALAGVGNALHDECITLEELIESGREIRGQILKDKYGIDPDFPARQDLSG